jgi:predicted RNA polymerase sigma factor
MKEALGSAFILEAEDLDAAIEVASRVPGGALRWRRRAPAVGGAVVVDTLDLADFRYLHSTRADLRRRLDRAAEGRSAYARARELTAGEAERRFLDRRLEEVS